MPELNSWLVIETHEEEFSEEVLQKLQADPLVNILRGQWEDLLIRHGDDGGWCVDTEDPQVRQELSHQRQDLPESGRVFYLLIRRG